jgi:hypothetical protein
VAPLFDRIDGRITRVTADGAYDGAPTYQTIATHGDRIEVVIPPRSTAVRTGEPGSPTQRDRHLEMITERGRLAWQAIHAVVGESIGHGGIVFGNVTARSHSAGWIWGYPRS